MATIATARMTAEEFCEWANRPENQQQRWELDRGEPVEMPPPGNMHGTVAVWIAHLLWQFAIQRGKGRVVGNDSGLLVSKNPDTLRGPDLMFFDESRRLEDIPNTYTEQIPQVIVEVLSPSDRWSHLQRRVRQYLDRGVPLIWVVDPEERTVTVFRSVEQLQQLLEETDELTGNGILPDFHCRVADLFTLPGQP